MTARVLILQRRLPEYRVRFFDRLHELLAARGVDLTLVHGEPAKEELSRDDRGRLEWATAVKTRYLSLFGGRVVLQPVPRSALSADLVVAPHESSYLPGHRFLVRRTARGQRFAYWGHGALLDDGSPRQRAKRFTSTLPDWWFAYTQLSVERVAATGFPRARITCVENSVETGEAWTPGDPELARARDEARRELGLGGTEPTAVFLGSLSADRCLELLIDAADLLRGRMPGFQLVVVGDGPMLPFLRSARAERPWLHLAGARHGREKVAWCSLGTVMVNPGMVGLNIVDAFALRVPMVTTDYPRHSPEIAYLAPGENGLSSPHRADAFAAAVEAVLRDDALHRRLVAGCERAAARYTVENMASRFAGGIVAALEAPRRTRRREQSPRSTGAAPRVLVLHPALAPYRVDVFNALAARCPLRVVFLRENPREQAFDQARLHARLTANAGHLSAGFTVLGRTFRLGIIREIRRFRPDVVVTPEFSPTTIGVALNRFRLPRPMAHVIWTDDNPASVERDSFFRRAARKFALRRADSLIVLSEEAAELYRTRYGVTIPIGVSPLLQDEQAFRGRLREAEALAAERIATLGLAGGRVLLYVGRLAPEKRVDRLVQALPGVLDAVPGAVLLIVGDGPERTRLEGLARAQAAPDRVLFVGRHEGRSLDAWYLVGSAFALASEFEPFGAVVDEALMAGLPVVCSDRAGARALVSGDAGSVVDAGDPEALGAAIRRWLASGPPVPTSPRIQERPARGSVQFSSSIDALVDLLVHTSGEDDARAEPPAT